MQLIMWGGEELTSEETKEKGLDSMVSERRAGDQLRPAFSHRAPRPPNTYFSRM